MRKILRWWGKTFRSSMVRLGFLRRSPQEDFEYFLGTYYLDETDILDPKRKKAVMVAVAEWSHQLRVGKRSQTAYAVALPIAPIAAATATVLAAYKSTSAWAVIPSAVATVAATLLAGFGFKEDWQRRRGVRHDLGPEIVEFIMSWGDYRGLKTTACQIDHLMLEVRKAAKEGSSEQDIGAPSRSIS